MKPLSPLKQKILLTLMAGITLGFTYSPNKHYKIYSLFFKAWKEINRTALNNAIRDLYRSKLIKQTQNKDGSYTFILSDKGKKKVLTYRYASMKIQKKKWDSNWRFVCFDIPEKLRKSRDVLRIKLKQLGFHELQKSIFVLPYKCEDEINFVIEYLNLRTYVRYGMFHSIDNELHLKKIFNIS